MRKLFILSLSIASLAVLTTSCAKSGCPMQITKEIKYDKKVTIDQQATALVMTENCNY
ncbi:MAG: hypothetical protein KDD32_00685 [Bacteroidetes bacterium]|nr:hypothetical protein [Bacteroidota bacterium]